MALGYIHERVCCCECRSGERYYGNHCEYCHKLFHYLYNPLGCFLVFYYAEALLQGLPAFILKSPMFPCSTFAVNLFKFYLCLKNLLSFIGWGLVFTSLSCRPGSSQNSKLLGVQIVKLQIASEHSFLIACKHYTYIFYSRMGLWSHVDVIGLFNIQILLYFLISLHKFYTKWGIVKMALIYLTQPICDKALPTNKRYDLRDTFVRGLFLRVEVSGRKTWYLSYRTPPPEKKLKNKR